MRLAFATLTLLTLSLAAEGSAPPAADTIIPQLRPVPAQATSSETPEVFPRPRPSAASARSEETETSQVPQATLAPQTSQVLVHLHRLTPATEAPDVTPRPAPLQRAAAEPALAVLSSADVHRYRQILTDERTGNFTRAKRLTRQLHDKSLLGYVKAEYLLSPHSGHMSSRKLIDWMHRYRTLPVAERIRRLAKRRAGRHHYVPHIPAAHYRGGGYEDYDPTEKPIRSRAGRYALRRILSAISIDKPERADKYLQSLIRRHRLPQADIARLARRICLSYLIEDKPAPALELAEAAADDGGRDAAPRLDWCAGLAAYHLGQFARAADHFETLSQHEGMPDTVAAGAWFWAARANLRAGDSKPVVAQLQQAAKLEPTFYGLLAETLLGQDPAQDFQDPTPDPDALKTALRHPATRRAVALWQINPRVYAGYISKELNRGFGSTRDAKLDVAYAWIARQIGAPNIEMRASESAAAHSHILLTGLFPEPPYTPHGGYTIDKALVLAFARIESRFQARVTSPAGAIGLMQLMPATARLIGGHHATRHALRNPAYNLSLGQRYIARMLDFCDGNLIKMAAAYNAGPGKVQQWSAVFTGGENDALYFLETMHAAETRTYVRKLMTYYWMYHRADGRAAPSLIETARGIWPEYHPPKQSAPAAPPPDEDEEDADDALS